MVLLNRLRSFDLRKAGICSAAIGIINIILHCLVICQVVPYEWVNGGRTQSFAEAQSISGSSIVLTIINIIIALAASRIINIRMNRTCGIILSAFLIITLPFGFIGVVQQFLGTIFEKCVTSIIAIIGFCADVRIAFEKRW